MADLEEFRSTWNARFPSCKPPDLACFSGEQVTKTGLEESLRHTKQRINDLTEEIKQQEFIASFLHEKIFNSALINGVTVEESEDLDSPIPTIQDTKTDNANCQPVVYTNVDSQKQAVNIATDGQAGVYAGVSTFKPTSSIKHKTLKNSESPDLVTQSEPHRDRCSTLHFEPGHKPPISTEHDHLLHRHSLKKTYSEPRRHSSLADSGTRDRKSINKPPVPAPRPSIRGPTFKPRAGVGSFLRTESTESADSFQDTVSLDSNPEQGDSGTDSPGLTPSNSPQVSKAPPLLRPLKNVKMKDAIIEDTNVHLTTFKKNSPTASPRPMKKPSYRHVNAYATVDIDYTRKITIQDGETGSKSGDEEDNDYDSPLAVNKDDLPDDTSSEDEEPVYLNIMLMKKQSMSKIPETIYASVNINKKSEHTGSKLNTTLEETPPIPPKSHITDSPKGKPSSA